MHSTNFSKEITYRSFTQRKSILSCSGFNIFFLSFLFFLNFSKSIFFFLCYTNKLNKKANKSKRLFTFIFSFQQKQHLLVSLCKRVLRLTEKCKKLCKYYFLEYVINVKKNSVKFKQAAKNFRYFFYEVIIILIIIESPLLLSL